MYETLALYYDALMDDIDYDFFTSIVTRYIPSHQSILDVGCGTGEILWRLAKKGYHTLGVDRLDTMLSITKRKLDMHHVHAPLFLHDLEQPLPEGQYQNIIAFFDVVHHIKPLKTLFNSIYQGLIPGGLFLFDMHTTMYMEELNGFEEQGELLNGTYHWRSQHGKDHTLIHHVEFNFPKNKKTDTITQYRHTITEALEILQDIGFNVLLCDESDETKHFIRAYKPTS